jgi:hypothetical protein
MGIEIDLEQGDLAKEMDKLIKLKFDTLDATQKALKAKKLKKTVKRKKSLRGAAVGNNRTTATAKDRSGYNKPQ